MKYTFARPIHVGPSIVSSVEIREPSGKELLALARGATGDEYTDCLRVMSAITGLPTKALDEQLSGKDFLALSKCAASIFSEEAN